MTKIPSANEGGITAKRPDELKPSTYGETNLEQAVYDMAYLAARSFVEKSRLTHENKFDSLTGLLNRDAWYQLANEAAEQNIPFGVIFADLDNFKLVNDTHGHSMGDKILKEYADVLANTFRGGDEQRPDDSLAHERLVKPANGEPGRFGGDEFKILVELGSSTDPASVQNANEHYIDLEERMAKVAKRFNMANEAFVQSHPELSPQDFGISFGYTVWTPESGLSVAEALHEADDAMYAVKSSKHH